MSLTEYLNQKNPQRTPSGAVHLKPNECQVYPSGVPNINNVVLKVMGRYYTYVTKPLGYVKEKRSVLYATDDDGNPTSPSCFSIPSDI